MYVLWLKKCGLRIVEMPEKIISADRDDSKKLKNRKHGKKCSAVTEWKKEGKKKMMGTIFEIDILF
jgi:hypothetical protein